MAFITFWEIFDILIMIAAAGFIFMALLKPKQIRHDTADYDPVKQYTQKTQSFFSWENFLTACLIAGPAIVLHELGHKFAALAFGLPATLHAPYTWLLFAVILVLIGSPIVFFVGGYVTHAGGTILQNTIISFMGPLVNLLLWLTPLFILSNKKLTKKMNRRTLEMLFLTKQINMFLFIFNMLPIPGFDGFSFFVNLFHLLF